MAAIQADGGPALSASLPAFRVNTENGTDTAMHSAKMSTPATSSGAQVHDKNIPLSARKGQRLDLATVERRGPGAQNRPSTRSERLFGLTEAPTFRPTLDEFKDPMAFIDSIREEGQRYGIVKIIPPDSWEPPFAVDTERFHFRTRRQVLNSIEGGSRTHLNYIDGLNKFHRQQGHSLNRFPSVDKRPLDLYKLKRCVETRGGFERVCRQKKWAEIGRDLGYSGKIMSSLSTSLKNSYQKWIHPFEEYLLLAKPGVHQMLEQENGGPYNLSPAATSFKPPAQAASTSAMGDSPTPMATTMSSAPVQYDASPPAQVPFRASQSSGFMPVNAGFTAVNVKPSASVGVPNPDESRHQGSPVQVFPGVGLSETAFPQMNATRQDAGESPHGFSSLKRQRRFSQDPAYDAADGEADGPGRRSKRAKHDASNAPTVPGSQMTQPRTSQLRLSTKDVRDGVVGKPAHKCEACGSGTAPNTILLCDSCDSGYHLMCLEPPLRSVPEYDWHCPKCLVGTGEFGFEDGGVYSLKQFQDKARSFKEGHFNPKMPIDPATNAKRRVTEDDIEREFWRLVESIKETVEVEYGADIHSTTHGSAFPTVERNPRDGYSTDPWNLNMLPYHPQSLFRFINSDISGMTVPWLYVGMVFSTFCWHAEDHYTYSANYQHFGETKTWYGIPGEDAAKFEDAMRAAVPELFETQPDLLFQLVTLLTPEQLQKAGVRVYALDQRAGDFIVTFPQAYHAGFNHGFNFNEAVNFAPPDWEPFGELGVQRLQQFRRQPCFSHDELLLAAAQRKDISIKTAKWLAPPLAKMRDRELQSRRKFLMVHKSPAVQLSDEDAQSFAAWALCNIKAVFSSRPLQEDAFICEYCKCYSLLSRCVCQNSGKVLCLEHAGIYKCCSLLEGTQHDEFLRTHEVLLFPEDNWLNETVQKIVDKAAIPEAWVAKLDALLEEGPKPQLKALKALAAEGERIEWDIPGLSNLKDFVEQCSQVSEEAVSYTRKQPVQRKKERHWRRAASKAADIEERERELRKMNNLTGLLAKANHLGFDSPEVGALRTRVENINEFRRKAQDALRETTKKYEPKDLEEILEEGRSFPVDIPELEPLDRFVQQLNWLDVANDPALDNRSLQEAVEFLEQGRRLGFDSVHADYMHWGERVMHGQGWENKAKELMGAEQTHFQQLEALAKQAVNVPHSHETLAQVEAILKKQRDASDRIRTLVERSANPEFRQRPKWREAREALDAFKDSNNKPLGFIDLEREVKRHEAWMRRGKKLFGKANAPLHILLSHMLTVDEKNRACFNLLDQPRMPVEPASRLQTPNSNENDEKPKTSPDAFCICRKSEGGIMVECDLCHEWYHNKCLKLARGKIKPEDPYTCPICDYRVRIPRDASRPKLEDLQLWQDEMPVLPFQPDEEETLESIISHGLAFREWVAKFINPLMSSPDELSAQRFYLRKLEGAEILLMDEVNFFRQELHKWAPIAPAPPPVLHISLSTRKPRPTKQQKIMQSMGVKSPEDLPGHFRTRNFTRGRRLHDPNQAPPLLPPQQQQQPQSLPEPSHTPPGMPRDLSMGMAGDMSQTGYFDHPASTRAPREGAAFHTAAGSLEPLRTDVSHGPLDPAMFSTSVATGSPSSVGMFGGSSAPPGEAMFESTTAPPADPFFGLVPPEEIGSGEADPSLGVPAEPQFLNEA